MSAHTPGPWVCPPAFAGDQREGLYGADSFAVVPAVFGRTMEQAVANATRIVACVNEMDGLDPKYARWAASHYEEILQRAERQIEEIVSLRAANVDLVRALEGFIALDQSFTTAEDRHLVALVADGGDTAKVASAVLAARSALARSRAP